MAQTETPYMHLPLYTDKDPADFRDKLNRSMIEIDRKIHEQDVTIQMLRAQKDPS